MTYLQQMADLKRELTHMPGIVSPILAGKRSPLDAVVKDPELRNVVAKLFDDGHHSRAVEEAFKFLNNLVKRQSGCSSEDGSDLMMKVFSSKGPILKLNELANQSEKNEQQGYMFIFAGAMTGIRNPRAHEHDWEDTATRALELLSLANHLVEKVRQASKSIKSECT